MKDFLYKISKVFTNLADIKTLIIAILFIAMFTIAYYFVFKFLKKNKANVVISIFAFVFALTAILMVIQGGYYFAKKAFIFIPIIFFIVVAVLFSVEIKRAIWSKEHSSKHSENRHNSKTYNEEEVENCIGEIIKAVQNMSKNDIGAIIVLSNGNVPNRIIESGVKLNSDITSQLIESIFFPKTPLHDGALIINGAKIVAAGCFLPLSQKENLPKDLGTRHRAGIGITETIDVTSIIVSEETGIISIVKAGDIVRYADSEMLRKVLQKFFWQDVDARR